MNPSSIVYIVDDDQAVRESISGLIEDQGCSVRAFASAEEFLAGYRPAGPGCLILDIRMPGMSGIDLLRLLSEKRLSIPTIVVSGHADIPLAVQAMQLGAVDLLEKPFRSHDLWASVRKAIDAGRQELSKRSEDDRIRRNLETLTPREREVVGQLLQGKNDKQAAVEFGITRRAVAYLRTNALQKLHAANLVELAELLHTHHLTM
jgi:two-component system, LuxR family, response regulator FixJ